MQRTQDFNELVDQVRIDLGAQIVGRICLPDQPLKVATLDASLEGAILGSLSDPATGQPMIEPGCGQMIAERVNGLISEAGGSIALIVQPPARRPLAKLLKTRAPQCLVLSINELPASQPVEVVAVIGENAEAASNPALSIPEDNHALVA
ncbi:FHIPEP family type III secretion protein [Altererythrobacter sp. GH1-8]|uniref:FHIPEP family type III secretion protein n=1 Tax=Altererythrobacter sp. GH1-8 TaxID=3349333 RepID=UPI00374DA06E